MDETDNDGRTALLHMAYGAHPDDEMKALISAGADVNHKDKEGRTPLMVLVSMEYPHAWADRILQALLDAGAKIDERDAKGMTALMWAAKKNRESQLVGLLLTNGADGYARSRAGKTAFDYAYRNPKLKDPAYLCLKEMVRPSPSLDDPASLEKARRQDRPLRVCLLLIPLVVNLGAGIWFMSILWAPPRGFWSCLAAVALLIGLNLNPFRLVLLLVRDRFPPRNPKMSLLSDWFPSDDCWGQVFWQTAVILFVVSLAVVNIPVIPAVTERWWGLVCVVELIAIGIFAYLKRRLFRSIRERIERAISW